MKRRFATPAIFLIVASLSQVVGKYSFIQIGNESLFLFTKDWLEATKRLEGNFIFNVCDGFLSQFFDLPLFAPIFIGLCAALVYLLLKSGFLRSGLRFGSVFSTAACCAMWYFATKSAHPAGLCLFSVLGAAFAYLVFRLFKKKNAKGATAFELIASAVIILAAASAIVFSKEFRMREAWNKVEICARYHDWDKVLAAATPARAAEDRELIPFALLALSQKESLPAKMFSYPVEGPEDMGMDGIISRRAYYFSSLLYECLSSDNEAIHNLYQYATYLPYGTSNMVLRQLVKLNVRNHNFTLARKYASILERSPRNRALGRKILSQYASFADATDENGFKSHEAPVITKNLPNNLARFIALGSQDLFLMDMFLCRFLLERDLKTFASVYVKTNWNGMTPPSHYQEALLLAGADPTKTKIPEEGVRRFEEYRKTVESGDEKTAESLSEGTFWEYYFRGLRKNQ